MTQAFAPLKRNRLSDQVSTQIQARIAAGELRSGDKLPPEREMAAALAEIAGRRVKGKVVLTTGR